MARPETLTEERPSLYERDFVLWLEGQAQLLREKRFDQLDLANLIEEIESMGRSEKRSIKSTLVVVLLHLLKHQYQPDHRSTSWAASIVEHRQRLRDDLEDSPSLRNYVADNYGRAYTDSRARAGVATGLPLKTFPVPVLPTRSSRRSIRTSCRTDFAAGGARAHASGRLRPWPSPSGGSTRIAASRVVTAT